MKLSIEFSLTDLGWADIAVRCKGASCELTASYLSDALGDLVLSAVAVMTTFRRLSFSFEEEPGEYRWVITSPRINEIEVAILSFPDRWSDKPDGDGRLLFKARCLPEDYAAAVLAAAQNVLESDGEAGYLERWGRHPFPTARLHELQGLIREAHGDGAA